MWDCGFGYFRRRELEPRTHAKLPKRKTTKQANHTKKKRESSSSLRVGRQGGENNLTCLDPCIIILSTESTMGDALPGL
jgi:hypothetical protein